MADSTIDLDRMQLKPGAGARQDLELEPATPTRGGIAFEPAPPSVTARVEISRTSSGYALRLLARTTVQGPCSRCLETAEVPVAVDLREVDQGGDEDSELRSPYVSEGLVDVGAWLSDGLNLELPEKVLCQAGCRGICPECGVVLNDVDPATHTHPQPLDPRFAKLRELGDQ